MKKVEEQKRARARMVVTLLRETYPESRCSLDHKNPFELLVATMLSAQCTDERVNRVTPGLFAAFPNALALAQAEPREIEKKYISSISFCPTKSRALVGTAQILVERHNGEVPENREALVALPGVGRKTANVVLGVAFGWTDAVVVDTHVKRIAQRLGLSQRESPDQIEQDLIPVLLPQDRVQFTHLVIDHGRSTCTARSPKCGECVLREVCPSAIGNLDEP